MTPAMRRPVVLTMLLPVLAGCALRGVALNSVANALSANGETFASDNDPELIRDAAPFALKAMESVLAERPRHADLLLALASGFTQYAYGFVETDALLHEDADPDRSRTEMARAIALYLRARDYGLRALELRHPGITAGLQLVPDSVVADFTVADVPALYWTAAAWGAAIAGAPDNPALMADFPAVQAMFTRALALDSAFGEGALAEAMISLSSIPAAMGGSEARAREYFARAVAMSGGSRAGPYVALATGVAVPAQRREEFVTLLETALAIDADAVPRFRLANLIMQQRARHLLTRVNHLFFEAESP